MTSEKTATELKKATFYLAAFELFFTSITFASNNDCQTIRLAFASSYSSSSVRYLKTFFSHVSLTDMNLKEKNFVVNENYKKRANIKC